MSAINSNPAPMLGTILNQGKKWKNWMSDYKNLGVTKVDLNLIEQTSSPKLGSIIETLGPAANPTEPGLWDPRGNGVHAIWCAASVIP